MIAALARSGTPLSILTKGTLLRRDLPLLAACRRDVPVGLGVSMAIWDDGLHATSRAGCPEPAGPAGPGRARCAAAGLPCGVFLAPVLPWLTDSASSWTPRWRRIAAAGATGVTVLPLHLRPGAREWFLAWLARERPALVEPYRRLYARGAYVPAEYRRWLQPRIAPLLARHGLGPGAAGRGAKGTDRSLPAACRPPRPRRIRWRPTARLL